MGEYRYRARDRHGDEFSKTIEADSLLDAANRLRNLEVDPIGLEAIDASRRRFEPVGERPGPAPRDIDVSLRDQPGGLVLLIVGGVFTVIASIIILAGIATLVAGEASGLLMVLIPLVHLAVGLGLLLWAFRTRAKRQDLYRHGEVAMATIDGVGYNRSVRVNGRHPYELVWTFDVAGHRYHDKRSTFADEAMTFAPGDRLWVLYDPNDPEQSVEWPPVTR